MSSSWRRVDGVASLDAPNNLILHGRRPCGPPSATRSARFDLRDERVRDAGVRATPAFGADGVLRLDASGAAQRRESPGRPGTGSAAPPKDSRAAAGSLAAAPGARQAPRSSATGSGVAAPTIRDSRAVRVGRRPTQDRGLFCRCGVAPWHPGPRTLAFPHGLCHSEVACDKCVVRTRRLYKTSAGRRTAEPLFWFRPDPHPSLFPLIASGSGGEPPRSPRNGGPRRAGAINEGAANRAPDGPCEFHC